MAGKIYLAAGLPAPDGSTGNLVLYGKPDGLLYFKDDASREHSLGYITSEFIVSGVISPAQIAANQNDYSPTGLATASVLRLTTDGTPRDLTGLALGQAGKLLIVHYVSGAGLTLKDENTGSIAANRFALVADIVLSPDDVVPLQYDAVSQRYRALSRPPSAGSGITTLNSQTGATQSFAKVDDTNVTIAIASSGNIHTLTAGWTGDLPFPRLVPASGASLLVGRGAASGAGDFQEISLGANLSMSGTTLSAAGGGSGTPGGSNTQLQYNQAGAFGGTAGLIFSGGVLTAHDTALAIGDVADTTKQIKFDAGGTTGTATTLVFAQTANRAINFPDAPGTVALTSDLASKQDGVQWKDEGTNLGASATVTSVDFTGAGVTATRSANALTVTITGSGSGQTAVQPQDEGSNLGSAGTWDILNFTGPGVTASRTTNTVTVNIPGGAGATLDEIIAAAYIGV